MKIKILGCGAAAGVPMVSRGWGKCDPLNPKNRRLRSSLYCEESGVGLLFDTGPDLREQLLTFDKPKIDAVLYTHLHADHTDGINELREINRINEATLPIYADKKTLKSIKERFGYAFEDIDLSKEPLYHVLLKEYLIEPYKDLDINSLKIKTFIQDHGYMDSLGYRIGDFAYSTDAVRLADKDLELLKGLKVWIVGCLDYGYHPTHAGVEQVLEWVDIIKPEITYLTHMSINMDYDTLCKDLPSNICPAYDGMEIEF